MRHPLLGCLFTKILVNEYKISMIFRAKLLYDFAFFQNKRMPGNILLRFVKEKRFHEKQASLGMGGEKTKNFIIIFAKFLRNSVTAGIDFYRNTSYSYKRVVKQSIRC